MKTINVLSRLWYDNEESELSFPDRWRLNRPKGGQISHKDGCRNVPPERSAVPPHFVAKISLTYKTEIFIVQP
jgi:hypothetical protein